MFISKKHINRRALLRGAGVALALPLLDAMIPAMTAQAKTAANPPPRFFGGFVPHGAAPGYWIPEKVGALPSELPFMWKPMEPFIKHVNILSGLHSRSAEPPPGATGADHWVASAFMCAVKPKKTAGADVACGTTIDQLIAKKLGRTRCCRLSNSVLKMPGPTPASATGDIAARIRIPCPGLHRRSHCPRKSIREWRSNGCLAMEAALKNVSPAGVKTGAFWTPFHATSLRLGRILAPATACCWTTILKMSAK